KIFATFFFTATRHTSFLSVRGVTEQNSPTNKIVFKIIARLLILHYSERNVNCFSQKFSFERCAQEKNFP
ncbi:MAG: hypothetical protein WCZ85_03410, partial [Bacilli bacterium]